MIPVSEVLSGSHDKSTFSCGSNMLDTYLQRQANQDIKRKLAACFVIVETDTKIVKGYYTLSNSSVPLGLLPEKSQKKLPKAYKAIPTTLLGRLAIDQRFKGQGLGKILLIDALKRSYEISKSVGSYAVIVDPIDSSAEPFYDKYGFIKLNDSGKMLLPMKTIGQLF